MESYNIIISVLVFILMLICFFMIISNLGIKNNFKNIDSSDSINIKNLEDKINYLKYEIYNLKIKSKNDYLENKIITSNQNNNNIQIKPNLIPDINPNTDNKEIVLETDSSNLIIVKNNEIVLTDNDNLNTNLNNNLNNINSNIKFVEPSLREININQPTNNLSCQASGTCNKPLPIIYDPIANYDIAKLTDPLVDPRGRTSADQIPTPQVAAQFNFPTQGVLDRYHRVGLLIAIDKAGYNTVASEFIWNGRSKTRKQKKKYEPYTLTTDSKAYRGVQIKEGFDSDSDSDLDSDSDSFYDNLTSESDKSGKNSITNVYNLYSNSNDNSILELIGKKVTDNWYKYFTSITMGNKIIKVNVHNKNRKELYSGDIVYIGEIKKAYRVKIDLMDMIEYNPYFF